MISPHTKPLHISDSVQYILYTVHQNKQTDAYAQNPILNHHHHHHHHHNHHTHTTNTTILGVHGEKCTEVKELTSVHFK